MLVTEWGHALFSHVSEVSDCWQCGFCATMPKIRGSSSFCLSDLLFWVLRSSLFLWLDGVKKAVRALDLTPKGWRRRNGSLSFFLSPFQNEQVFSRAVLSNPYLHFMGISALRRGWQIWMQNCPFMYNLWWTITWDQTSLHPEQNQKSVSQEAREGWVILFVMTFPIWLLSSLH